MKRLTFLLLFCCLLVDISTMAMDIYVSPNGADQHVGSKVKPLASLNMALRKAREWRRLNPSTFVGGIHIILQGGKYLLSESIFIRPEDAGTVDCPTFIEAAPNELPILSGGIEIKGWKKLTTSLPGLSPLATGNIWVADLPNQGASAFDCRQLWVNNQKAIRAKSTNGATMDRILGWNKQEESCWIPTAALPKMPLANGVEFFIHQWWAIAILRIRKVEIHGDSTKLFFQQPESRIQSEHPWPAPWISTETGNSAFYLTNALPFLDEPGEWYADVKTQKLYYWPRKNEQLPTATVIAPLLETLVKVQGTIDHPVENISFKGIAFQHTGWLRPSTNGHVPHQNGLYMTDAYKLKPAGTKDKANLENQAWIGRPAAAVIINYAQKVDFYNCRFEHLASTGLDYNIAIHHNTINGNLFKDIGGNGIVAGVYSDEATEIHLPYNPTDDREVCDGMTVSNNLVTDVSNEDWGCVGIGIGYARNTTVSHNEVENVSYSAITMGWGWSPSANAMKNNRITANKIHHFGKHNYDCAGIYTLSAQPNTIISCNEIDSIYKAPYAHLPSHWFYLYTDEGSSYIHLTNNWTPSTKYLQNANGPGNQWTNNGPQVHDSIRNNAGLQADFQYLRKEKTASANHLPINEVHKEIIEIVVQQDKSIDLQQLKTILIKSSIDTNALYQWKNHYVIFDYIEDILVLQGRLKNNFPGAEVKSYPDLFYTFDKQKHCINPAVSKEWDHIILTANLVDNKQLQQEYLNAHATQFEKWPEVAKGFCNANFQQLLVYRNNRQLMLVISIPKGESLDRLNPLTTANNPRMDQWNAAMKKYQEGIEGTAKGETWVFLQQIK